MSIKNNSISWTRDVLKPKHASMIKISVGNEYIYVGIFVFYYKS